MDSWSSKIPVPSTKSIARKETFDFTPKSSPPTMKSKNQTHSIGSDLDEKTNQTLPRFTRVEGNMYTVHLTPRSPCPPKPTQAPAKMRIEGDWHRNRRTNNLYRISEVDESEPTQKMGCGICVRPNLWLSNIDNSNG